MSSPEELVLSPTGERADAWLRLVGAIVLLPTAVFLVSDGGTPLRWTFALAALGASSAWIRGFVRLRRESPPARSLRIDADGVTLCSDGTTERLSWSEVDSIDVDEEALLVVIRRHAGEPLRIPPGFGGLGLDGLVLRLRAHRPGAHGPDRG